MRCEIPSIARRTSLYRSGPCSSTPTTMTVHLSPMRSSVSVIAWQSSCDVSILRTELFVALKAVPPCEKRPRSYYILTNKKFVKHRGEVYEQAAHRHRDLDHPDGTLRGRARRV